MRPSRTVPPLVLAALTASLLALGSCSKSSTSPRPQATVDREVTITLHDSLGAPRSGAPLWLLFRPTAGDTAYLIAGQTNASGRLTLRLEPGSWTVTCRTGGLVAGSGFTVTRPPAPPPDTQLVRLVLHAPSRAAGVATLAGRTDHRDIGIGSFAMPLFAGTDSTGAYALDGLPVGNWDVHFSTYLPGYSSEIRSVNVPAPGSTVTVPPVVLGPIPLR